MTTRQKKNRSSPYLKIALSVVILVLAAFAAVLFKAESIWTTWGIVCIVCASAAFATLLFITSYIHAGILCAAGIIAAALFSLDMISVIWSAVYIPAGWIIFYGVEKKITRTVITAHISIFLGFFYALLIIVTLAASNDGISMQIIYRAAEVEIDSVVENYLLLEDMIYTPEDLSVEDAAIIETQREILKQQYSMNLKVLVPVFFILYNLMIAYFATSLFRIVYNILIGTKSKSRALKRMDWRLKLSAISSVVMILSSVLNVLLYDQYNPLPWIIVSNIEYMLAPGFCVMGVYFLFDKIYNMYNRNKRIKSGVIPGVMFLFAFGFMMVFLQYASLAILAIFGLYAALIGDLKKFYNKTKKALFGDDDDEEI